MTIVSFPNGLVDIILVDVFGSLSNGLLDFVGVGFGLEEDELEVESKGLEFIVLLR